MRTRFSFRVWGRAQQRGSKKPMHVRRNDGSLVIGKNGQPLVVTPDANPKSRNWMNAVREAAAQAMADAAEEKREVSLRQPLTGPILLTVRFYFGRPKSHYGTGRNAQTLKKSAPQYCARAPDLSKLVRSLEDAMTGVIYRDDCQVVRYREVMKLWTDGQECTEVVVFEAETVANSQPLLLDYSMVDSNHLL